MKAARLSLTSACLFPAAALFPASATAQHQLFDRLTNVGIHVVATPESAIRLGIDSVALREHLEGRFREAGLGVRTSAELAARQETPRIVVNVGALTVDSAYFFSVILELLEPVEIKRSGAEIYGYNWSRQILGAAPLSSAIRATWNAVDQLTNSFLESRRRALSLAQAAVP